MDDVLSAEKLQRIRQLNDRLRQYFLGGRVMLTATVAALSEEAKMRVLTAVRGFSTWTPDNDPNHEHDMCFVEVDGEKYWAKVDYYDLNMQYFSEDPSDPEKTIRVLTIGHVTDY